MRGSEPDPAGPALVQRLPHRRAEAAHEDALLDRDEQLVLAGELREQLLVERLGEARVGDRDRQPALGQQVGRLERQRDPGAVADDGDLLALAQHLAAAVLHRRDPLRGQQRHAERLAAGVAQGHRAVVLERGAEHPLEHGLVARGHEREVRQRPQVGDVEGAVVRRAVVADEARAVEREDDVELLQADVVDDLVVRALQERRVDRADRLEALEGQAAGEEHRLLLGDPDVEVVLGLGLLEQVEPRAGVHRRRDADDAAVAADLLDHRLAEDLRVLRRGDGGAGGLRLCSPRGRRWRSTSAWPRARPPSPPGRRPRRGRSPCP